MNTVYCIPKFEESFRVQCQASADSVQRYPPSAAPDGKADSKGVRRERRPPFSFQSRSCNPARKKYKKFPEIICSTRRSL